MIIVVAVVTMVVAVIVGSGMLVYSRSRARRRSCASMRETVTHSNPMAYIQRMNHNDDARDMHAAFEDVYSLSFEKA